MGERPVACRYPSEALGRNSLMPTYCGCSPRKTSDVAKSLLREPGFSPAMAGAAAPRDLSQELRQRAKAAKIRAKSARMRLKASQLEQKAARLKRKAEDLDDIAGRLDRGESP